MKAPKLPSSESANLEKFSKSSLEIRQFVAEKLIGGKDLIETDIFEKNFFLSKLNLKHEQHCLK
jgi:hypothetical protein